MPETSANSPSPPAQAGFVLPPDGAAAYLHALGAAGGREVAALAKPPDRAKVAAVLYCAPPYDLQVSALPVARLSITLTAARVSGGLEGDRRRVYDSPRHALFLNPAGVAAHWRKESSSRHLNLYFDNELMAEPDASGASGGLLSTPLLNASAPGLKDLVDKLLAELQFGAAWSAEAADSLGRLMLIKLARSAETTRRSVSVLTPAQLARLNDYVHSHLAQRILVADLAQAVNLEPNRFARLYVVTTGRSPHQFVMATRLQHAAALLQSSALPLVDIAYVCGFANQQHMTSLMRSRLGATPGQLRLAQRAR